MTDVRDRIANLPPEQRAQLLARLKQAGEQRQAAPTRPPLGPAERSAGPLPLSFGQQRLWFLDQVMPPSAAYTIALGLRMRGELSIPALTAAVNAMVGRHEALRTIFPATDGEAAQHILPELRVELPLVDCSGAAATEREERVRQAIFAEAERSFDLAAGPLFRATLIRAADDDHTIVLTMHHIISDGWSIGVIIRELCELYAANAEGRAATLPPLTVQYADYTLWQRGWLKGEALDKQLGYWRERLSGAPAVLELPTDRPRPPVQTYVGGTRVRRLSRQLSDALVALSQREGATLFMTVLAAYQTMLFRYSGQRDIVVGSPIAGRTQTELEGLIGFFLNTMVLRTKLDGGLSFRALLKRVREAALGAYAHQDLPFERLVDELQPSRDLSHTPIFQVMFVLQNMPKETLSMPGLEVSRMPIENGTSQLDLALYVYDLDEGLSCHLEYNSDLYDAATADRMLGHLESLLAAAVAHPDMQLRDMPLLLPEEQRTLLEVWNSPRLEPVRERCVHQLFEEQAARTPDRIAARFGGASLTYAELDRRANQLAHALRERGVGPERLAAICLERSLDMIVALLAVLKAGGAYVPLDPALPQDRIAFIMEESDAAVLLTHKALLADLPAQSGHVLCLDADWPAIAALPATPLANTATPDSLIYTIYTSGSTGRPKGVQLTHRSVINFLDSMRHEPGMTQDDVLLSVTTLSFDIAGLEIYLPLITGAQVVLVGRDVALDGARLIELLGQAGVTFMQATPATWRLMLEAGWRGTPGLKVLCGGEALPRELANQLSPRCGSLWNMYGPTETTIWSSLLRIEGEVVEHSALIGRPIANTQLYILDAQLRPVPVGVGGELYIGGSGLARGYLGRPQLTAEKFVPSPFSVEPGARLYRTGDLARFRPDGAVEFLGRIDHQVKMRGFRIELGEIEAVLAQHPAVRQAVVALREDSPGDQRLVAYVVPASEAELTTQEIRAHLKAALPEYMVPSASMVLEALPLTPNGKVDRKALPAPTGVQPESGQEFVAPRTESEVRVAAAWAEVLGIEQIGIDHNFFDLGGDSFKAVRVVRALDNAIGVLDIFKSPTVRALAERIGGDRTQSDGLLHEMTPPRPAAKVTMTLVCVPFAGGSAVTYQPLAAALPQDYRLLALELPGHDFSRPDEDLMPFEEILSRCVAEVRERVQGPLALYGHCMGGALTTALARRLEAEGVVLEGVFIGGHFPVPRLPGKLFEMFNRLFPMERWTSKRLALDFLRSMGFFTDVLSEGEKDFVMRSFLRDARDGEDFYTAAYQAHSNTKLRAPIVSVIGQMDRVTELYEERYKEWSFFSDAVELAVIPQAGHYFLKHQPKELAGIISERCESWKQEPQAAPQQVPAVQPAQAAPAPAPRTAPVKQARSMPSLGVFFLIAFGQLISLIGTGLTTFAMGVWVYQQTGSVASFALISVCALLPAILLAPIAGAAADRWDRRKIMMLSDTLAGIGTITLAGLLWLDALQIWHIYCIVSVGAIANSFQQPAYMAAITQLVPKRYYGKANGIAQLGGATGTILAPLLGGALALLIGLKGIVLLDLATFLVAITITSLVRFPDALFKRREEPFMREVVSGWRYIIRRRGIVGIILFTVALNYFFSLVEVLATPLTLSLGSAAALGSVLAASGAGLLVGSIGMSVWGGTARRTTGILSSFVLIGVSMMLIGLRPTPIFPAVGLFGMGLAVAVLNAHWMSIVQAKVGLELQGRVVATTQMLSWAMVPLGYLSAGPLAEEIFEPLMAPGGALAGSIGVLIGTGPGRGMALITIIAGLLTVILGVIALRYRPVRYLEDQLPDAIPDAVIIADKDALQQQADQQLALSAGA